MIKTQSGRTMIEVIGVLGIIGMLAAGALMVAGSMFDKYKLSRTGQQLVEFQKSLSERYSAKDDYSELKLADIISEKIAPSDMIAGSTLKHRYGGQVTVTKALTGDVGVEITFKKIPPKACAEMVTMNWIVGDYTALYSIKINGDTYRWPTRGDAVTAKKLPIVINEATAGLCTSSNDISWTFY